MKDVLKHLRVPFVGLGILCLASLEGQAAGYPAANCRPGFQLAGTRLCINTAVQNAANFNLATILCKDQRATVASYEDLRYLYFRSGLDASYNPNGRWIGNMVGDDTALCGNRSITFDGDGDASNFEGQCAKTDVRSYWCAHDRE